jgi:hypothetical protein
MMQTHLIKKRVIRTLHSQLTDTLQTWIDNFANKCSGGKMRGDRGKHIETFVINAFNHIGQMYGKDIVAKLGRTDMKLLTIPGTDISKEHQVDVHVYVNQRLTAVVECKAYLDKCYYVRACDDFILFKKFGYNVKNYIFTLENGIDAQSKIFTDYLTENICDDVFCILDGKRSSSKPIYDENFRKDVNLIKLIQFVNFIYELGEISDDSS